MVSCDVTAVLCGVSCFALVVYTVDGGWGPWSPWSQCVGRCGSALRRRERNCTNPVPANEGRPCNSSGVEEEECTPKSCEGNQCFINMDRCVHACLCAACVCMCD